MKRYKRAIRPKELARDSRKLRGILDEVISSSSGCTNKQLEDYINKIYDERFPRGN